MQIHKPRNYWTKDKCQEEALKYNNRMDFRVHSASAYQKSIQNKWLNDICSHMTLYYKPNGYWTKERCQEEALKYISKKEFNKKSRMVYKTSMENKWLGDICSHMVQIHKPKNYWTKENCKNVALLCKTKSEFQHIYGGAYRKSRTKGWLGEITMHMVKKGNRYKKCIYAYEFPDNSVYIGLTYNMDVRKIKHNNDKRSAVFNHIKKTNLNPVLKILTDFLNVDIASKLEGNFVDKYRKEEWKILNKIETGGIGGNVIKWNKSACQIESLKYTKRSDFFKFSRSAYISSSKHKWLDEICSHMKPSHMKKLSKDECQSLALKYKNRSAFRIHNKGAYNTSIKNGWLDEICGHMIKNKNK